MVLTSQNDSHGAGELGSVLRGIEGVAADNNSRPAQAVCGKRLTWSCADSCHVFALRVRAHSSGPVPRRKA